MCINQSGKVRWESFSESDGDFMEDLWRCLKKFRPWLTVSSLKPGLLCSGALLPVRTLDSSENEHLLSTYYGQVTYSTFPCISSFSSLDKFLRSELLLTPFP